MNCYTNNGIDFHKYENRCFVYLFEKIYAYSDYENKNICNIENCQICRNKTECFQYKAVHCQEKGQSKEKCFEGCYMCSTYDKWDYCRIRVTKNSVGKGILINDELNFNVNLYNYKKKLLIEYFYNIKNNDISSK